MQLVEPTTHTEDFEEARTRLREAIRHLTEAVRSLEASDHDALALREANRSLVQQLIAMDAEDSICTLSFANRQEL